VIVTYKVVLQDIFKKTPHCSNTLDSLDNTALNYTVR